MLCFLEAIVGRALTLHVVTKVYYFISPITTRYTTLSHQFDAVQEEL